MAPRPPNKRMGLPSQQEAPPLAISDNVVFKNRLQELTEKLGLPPPACLTINIGSSYAPKFKTTVLVNGVHYTAQNSCSNSAEQEALRIAYDSIKGKDCVEGHPPRNQTGKKRSEEAKSPITSKFQAMAASSRPSNKAITECTSSKEQEDARNFPNVEGYPPLYQNGIYCKTILYEYSVKKKLNKPIYRTKSKAGFPPRFISCVDLNGEEYIGEEATSKKEAEQLAAQVAIISLLGSDSRTLVLIIKSKEIIFDPHPPPKPLLCIEHGQPLPSPSAIGLVHTRTVIPPSTGRGSLIPIPSFRPPTFDQGSRGPTFTQQTEIKQGENPEEAHTMRETVTSTNHGPGNYNARAKRKAESINWAQKKRK